MYLPIETPSDEDLDSILRIYMTTEGPWSINLEFYKDDDAIWFDNINLAEFTDANCWKL